MDVFFILFSLCGKQRKEDCLFAINDNITINDVGFDMADIIGKNRLSKNYSYQRSREKEAAKTSK